MAQYKKIEELDQLPTPSPRRPMPGLATRLRLSIIMYNNRYSWVTIRLTAPDGVGRDMATAVTIVIQEEYT